VKQLDPEAARLLAGYDWHRNNVRELKNAIERLIIAAPGDLITADQVPAEFRGGDGQPATADAGSLQRQREDAERDIVRTALERNDGHLTRTARDLGLADHASLSKVMKRLGIYPRP